MAGLEELSKRLFRQLDSTGYSHQMIGIRRKVYRCLSKLETDSERKVIYSGSKGEGMTKCHESDEDILYLWKNIVCIDDPAAENLIQAQVMVFIIRNTQPGYCMLELPRQGTIHGTGITDCLVPFNGTVMLSSELLRLESFNSLQQRPTSTSTRTMTGPADTCTLQSGAMIDRVLTFSCVCRSILEDWANRHRTYDWPPSYLRQSLLQMMANLVATGSDDSETKHLEFRYCFNEIEMRIVETLNDTQLKLYKVLKIINTDIFKQRGLSLTSFIMKNIVLWIAESHPQSQFLPDTLFYWVCEALVLLKQYVVTNIIPYYMIPGRNLLKEKVKESDRPKLIQAINNALHLGPVLLYMCKTFRNYINFTPSEFLVLKQKLEVLELCHLYIIYYQNLLLRQGRDRRQDILYTMFRIRRRQILRSGWPPQIQQKIRSCKNPFEALKMLLS